MREFTSGGPGEWMLLIHQCGTDLRMRQWALFFSDCLWGSSASLEKAVRKAFQEIDRLNSMMSHYKPESELCAINREAWRRNVAVTPELFKLLEDSPCYSEETTGTFDITIGPLMKSWGFFRGWGRLPIVGRTSSSSGADWLSTCKARRRSTHHQLRQTWNRVGSRRYRERLCR